MKKNLFDGFIKEQNVSRELCNKYENLLPGELLELWNEYGFGSFMDGYLKLINPEEYQELVCETYFRGDYAIPMFMTAFGDIILWEDNKYIRMVKYKNGIFKGMASGFDFFLEDLNNGLFDTGFFEFSNYTDAVKILGKLNFNECFGYVPLLGLGGSEKVENLKKVKVREHILIISQLVGKVGL